MKAKLGVLGLLAVVLLGTTAANCDNDGLGQKGRVTGRTKDVRTHTYRLQITDETRGPISFVVPVSVWNMCSPGEYYPGCKVKW